MKTTPRPTLPLLATLALLLGTATAVSAYDAAPPAVKSTYGVRVTDKDEFKELGFDKLKGAAVRGADGKQLGRLRDLILDAQSGAVRFAVISGGGFFHGDAKVLPFDALMRDAKDHSMITRLQRVDWELLPELEKADIKEGRVALSSEQRRHLDRLRDQNWARSLETLAAETEGDRTRRFVFASALAGQALHGDNEKVGKVDDLVIDPHGGPALAVVDIDRDYVGADHKYLVPIDALQVPAGGAGRVHTTLAASEFRRAAGVPVDDADRNDAPWQKRRARDNDRRHADEVRIPATPAPTGRADGYSTNLQQQTETLRSAARAVTQAWQGDPDLRQFALRVTPTDGRLVLEGKVPTVKYSTRAKDLAERATSRIPIENRIDIGAP